MDKASGMPMPNAPDYDFNDVAPPTYFESIRENVATQNSETIFEIVDSANLFPDCSQLTADLARRHLMDYANREGYISKSAVRKMKINKIDLSFVHSYTLESFTQRRQTSWEFQTYKMGRVDDQSFGRMPTVWEIDTPAISNAKLFCNKSAEFIVPHSEYVQPCHSCSPASRSCWTCSGNNKLKYYLKCKVIWTNHKNWYISRSNNIPKEKIGKATGVVAFKAELPMVKAINYVQNEELTNACHKLIETHRNKFKNEKLIKQRHYVFIIPIATVHYTLSQRSGQFFLLGLNFEQVHCPDFPISTCSLM